MLCKDTIEAMVACITSESLNVNINVNEADTICLDTLELMGEVVNFENVCEANSGEYSLVANRVFPLTGFYHANRPGSP